jgi:hypothetical protein
MEFWEISKVVDYDELFYVTGESDPEKRLNVWKDVLYTYNEYYKKYKIKKIALKCIELRLRFLEQ